VDDFGIARRDARADAVGAFQHEHVVARFGQLIATGETHCARTNHYRVEIAHGVFT
jgi:hypothetical protein